MSRSYRGYKQNHPSRMTRSRKSKQLLGLASHRLLRVEHLEERRMLSASPYATEAVDSSVYIDSSVHVDSQGNTFFVEPLPVVELLAASSDGTPEQDPPFPSADTFLLHSNPGATKVVYLDFDGHTTTGTQWNNFFGDPIVTPAYTIDSSSNFSESEKERIQNIWERVSEDFLPFDVDITTEDPGVAALTNSGGNDNEWGVRVVIGENTWYSSAGGVAYLNLFNWDSDTPVFVFNTTGSIAETASHEIGHALGLGHHGRTNPFESYYGGHGSGATGWTPIMGTGNGFSLVQWSKGEYPDANNAQDDLDIIVNTSTSPNNGFGYRADDHGSSVGSASSLVVTSGTTLFGEGIVEQNTDQDFFSFTTTEAETLQFTINPFYNSPRLDILATLYDSSGTPIGTSNPDGELGADFAMTLGDAGTYYVSVEGVGRIGDGVAGPDYGYSDYGSLGYYSIDGTLGDEVVLTVTVDSMATSDSTPQLTGTINDLRGTVLVDIGGQTNLPAVNNGDGTWTLTDNLLASLADGTYDIQATATNLTSQVIVDSTTDELIVDTIAPTVSVNSFSTADSTPTLSGGIDEPTATVLVAINGQTNLLATNHGNGTWTLPGYNIIALGLGTYDVAVTATDLALNVGVDSTVDELVIVESGGNTEATFTNSSTILVPGSGTEGNADLYPSTLLVSGVSADVFDVNVTLEGFSHEFPDDVDVLLVGPAGQTVVLMSDAGAAYAVTDVDLTFDSGANSFLSPNDILTTGHFLPTNLEADDTFSAPAPAGPYGTSLGAFIGTDPNGIWSLYVVDDNGGDTGEITNGWSVTFNSVSSGDDDHGDTFDVATAVATPSSNAGDLETLGDADFFSFTAVAGTDYRFLTTLDTLSDSTLRLYDTHGNSSLLFDNNGGVGSASFIEWNAPANGIYFLEVRGINDTQTGTYTLDLDLNASWEVTHLNDSGAGSLRQAILDANADLGADSIIFTGSVFEDATADVIAIASQLPAITGDLSIYGPGQDLLTIDAGNGADNTFATGDGYRIFDIDYGKVLLSGLTLTGGDTANGAADPTLGGDGADGGAIRSEGRLTIDNLTITGNATGDGGASELEGGKGGAGGGIFSGRTLTILSSTLSGNVTGNGGVAEGSSSQDRVDGGDGGPGGGIYLDFSSLVMTGSTVTGNSTGAGGTGTNTSSSGSDRDGDGGDGGGIYIGTRRDVTISSSHITQNFTQGSKAEGGGIFADDDFTLDQSTISGNSTSGKSSEGGGIYVRSGLLTMSNSTVSGNSTTGLFSGGGGVNVHKGDFTATNSTFSGNSTSGNSSHGAGIAISNSYSNSAPSATTIRSSTVTDNHALGSGSDGGGLAFSSGSVLLSNTIIAENSAEDDGQDIQPGSGTLTANYTLIGEDEGLTLVGDVGNQTGSPASPLDPQLAPLANNGGPTETHALVAGSPAIDSGYPAATPGTEATQIYDQRGVGYDRVNDGRIDIGAIEVQDATTSSADFNEDGDIDGSDFLAWQRGFGTPAAGLADGDADGDGDVDAADLGVWGNQFGTPPVLASFSAPAIEQSDEAAIAETALPATTFSSGAIFLAWQQFSTPLSQPRIATEIDDQSSAPAPVAAIEIALQQIPLPASNTLDESLVESRSLSAEDSEQEQALLEDVFDKAFATL